MFCGEPPEDAVARNLEMARGCLSQRYTDVELRLHLSRAESAAAWLVRDQHGRHDRMPVPLTEEQFEPWLIGKAGVECLRPAPDNLLQKWPVSKRVNSSKAAADDASLIEEAAA